MKMKKRAAITYNRPTQKVRLQNKKNRKLARKSRKGNR